MWEVAHESKYHSVFCWGWFSVIVLNVDTRECWSQDGRPAGEGRSRGGVQTTVQQVPWARGVSPAAGVAAALGELGRGVSGGHGPGHICMVSVHRLYKDSQGTSGWFWPPLEEPPELEPWLPEPWVLEPWPPESLLPRLLRRLLAGAEG